MSDTSADRTSRVAIHVLLAALVAAGGMAVLEWFRGLVAPHVSPWTPRVATVGLATVTAIGIALALSRRARRVAEALAGSRDFYAEQFEDFPNLIWRASKDRQVDYFNHSWIEFTGRPVHHELGDGWMKGIHPDDLARYAASRRVAFIRREPFQTEYRLKRHDDAYRWMVEQARPLWDGNGEHLGFIGVCSDVTEVKDQAEKLDHLSTHDALTGLPNRRSLEDALEREVARAARDVPGALLYMDVDNFKGCNDTRGHDFGDVVLIGVAEVLRKNARREEMVARLGGDEFAMILERATPRTARFVADRLRDGVRRFALSQKVELDLSVGAAIIDGKSTGGKVLRAADTAMYEAKQAGKARTVVTSMGSKCSA